jgi:hypothetical protein
MANPKHSDSNETAARIVSETISQHEQPLPADLEAAWKQWSTAIQKVDARGMVLLRAAFEAGVDVGRRLPR